MRFLGVLFVVGGFPVSAFALSTARVLLPSACPVTWWVAVAVAWERGPCGGASAGPRGSGLVLLSARGQSLEVVK